MIVAVGGRMYKKLSLLCVLSVGSIVGVVPPAGRWAGDDANARCERACKAKCETYCSVRGGMAKHSCSGHVGSDDELYANCDCVCKK